LGTKTTVTASFVFELASAAGLVQAAIPSAQTTVKQTAKTFFMFSSKGILSPSTIIVIVPPVQIEFNFV
jgi:hypothetical protein